MKRPVPGRRGVGESAAAAACLLLCAATACHFATAADRNLIRPRLSVLIVVDTLRADHLGVYGHSVNTSPRLDEWAKRGVVFDRAWATASWTLPSFASMWTGLLPDRHGAGRRTSQTADFTGIRRDVPTLGEELLRADWTAVGFATNRFLQADYGFARGFAVWDWASSKAWRDRRADVVVDRAISWLKSWDGRPTFLLLHLFDPHLPYDPPSATSGRFSPPGATSASVLRTANSRELRGALPELDAAERQQLEALYDEEIAFVDREVDRFLSAIESRGLFEDSVIAFTSDHGEELFDHGGLEHGHSHFEEVLRVPLVIWARGLRPGRLTTSVSVVDLYPTFLVTAGLDPPPSLDGISLWPALRRVSTLEARPIAAQGNLYGDRLQETLLVWPWKRIVSPGSNSASLFDLSVDPSERSDLERIRRLERARLQRLRLQPRHAVETEADAAERELDQRVRDELQALGYL